jgi:hypothetical protein
LLNLPTITAPLGSPVERIAVNIAKLPELLRPHQGGHKRSP